MNNYQQENNSMYWGISAALIKDQLHGLLVPQREFRLKPTED